MDGDEQRGSDHTAPFIINLETLVLLEQQHAWAYNATD